jgi:hypothetical protein
MKFKVFRNLVGGAAQDVEIEADKFSVGLSGTLEFWRVTEAGDGLIMAINRDYWITCEEVK